jgi:hypothetical protein
MTALTDIPAADLLSSGDCTPQCLLALEAGGLCACRCGGKWHGSLTGASVTPSEVAVRTAPRRPPVSGPAKYDNDHVAAIQEAIRHHRPTPGPPPRQPEVYPDWGWWPDDAWWRTWWQIEQHRLWSGDQGWAQLDEFTCPERTATEAFGLLIFEAQHGPAAWQVGWIQRDADWQWSAHLDIAHCQENDCIQLADAVQEEFLTALRSAERCTDFNAGERAAVFGLDQTEARVTVDILDGLAKGHTETALACVKALRRSGS